MNFDYSVELAVPFRVAADGSFAVVSDPNTIQRQHVMSLIGTQKGERVMRPTYGVNIQRFLFAQNDPTTQALLQSEVKTAMETWEPTVKLNTATMEQDEDNIAHLSVTYRAAQTNMPSQVATVDVSQMGR